MEFSAQTDRCFQSVSCRVVLSVMADICGRAWRGKDGNFCSDGLPHVSKIDRKLKGVDTELKDAADAESKAIIQIEIQEGKEEMNKKECMDVYKKAGTAQVLRLTKPWHGTGRAAYADSAFASVTTAIACHQKGLHFTGLVKTATTKFPKKFLDSWEYKELGDSVTLVAQHDGYPLIAHEWRDKVRKNFISTRSVTLDGRPSNKRRWREMLDADGNEVGLTEAYVKHMKRSKLVEEYFDSASVIDINNHVRHGGLSLETAWKTQNWSSRTILGIIETGAYLMWKHFQPDGRNWDHASFNEELAMQLLSILEDETSPNVSLDSSADVDTFKGHEIHSMCELEQYKGQTSSGKSRVPLRRCRMCGGGCKYYCKGCSSPDNNILVPLCGLKSKNGSTCIMMHIQCDMFKQKRICLYDSVVICLLHYVLLYQSDVVDRVVLSKHCIATYDCRSGYDKNGCVTLCAYSILVFLAAF